ncbi:MAG: TPM domain-containing protein, partial [Roseimicrobium sp.]
AMAQTPERPRDGVYDETLLFTESDQAAVSARLATAARQTGVQVLIAGLTFSRDATARDTAVRLASAWGREEPCVLLVFDRGKDSIALGCNASLWNRYPVDELFLLFTDQGKTEARGSTKPEVAMKAAMERALQSLQRLETARQKRERILGPAEMRLLQGVAFGMGLFLLACALAAYWAHCARLARTTKHFFPDVHMEMRLGAPYGGGAVMGSDELATR